MSKKLSEVTPDDFEQVAVWRSAGEGELEPLSEIEEIADGSHDLWVGVHGKLADETAVRGFARVECPPPALHDHTLFVGDQMFRLTIDASGRIADAEAMADSLQRPLTHVFPIYLRAEVKAECTGDNISQEIDVTGPQPYGRD